MQYRYGDRHASPPEKLERRLWLARYLDLAGLPPRPDSVDHSVVGMPSGMLGNDSVGDCVEAEAGHAIEVAWWYGLGKAAVQVTANAIIAVYSAITGYVPGDPSTDQGSNLLDVLGYWRKHPICGAALDGFVAFDPTKPDHWKAVIDLYGVAFFGAWLPQDVVDALDNGTVIDWTSTKYPVTHDAGHGIDAVGYDATGVKVSTWGGFIHATWAWLAKYCDETYAPLMKDWASGKEPGGFNEAQLQADLAIVSGGGIIPVDPPVTPPVDPPVTPPVTPPKPNPSVLAEIVADVKVAAEEIAHAAKRIADALERLAGL
jgi:hypothetical protein